MRLLVVGASRGIGKATVRRALDDGHEVTALARNLEGLGISHPRLRLAAGDIRDLDSVSKACAGQRAVICSLGTGPTRKKVDLFSVGTGVLLEAMRAAAVRRLICVTGIGAGDSRGHGGFLYDRIFFPLLVRTIYEDKDRQEGMVRSSDTDWTIVRPGFLTNGAATDEYQIATDMTGITAHLISRADVAAFLLEQLDREKFLRKTVFIG